VRDGANKALNRLVQFLLDHGAAVRVYSPTAPTPAFEPAGDLVSVPSFGIPTRSEYRIAPRLPRASREDIIRFAPTHVHLSAPDWLGFSALALARQIGVPVIASLHTRFETYLDYYGLHFLKGWMERRIDRFYSGCDYVLAPNEPIAELLRAKPYGDRVRIWGRGVNRDIFNPARRDPDWRAQLGFGQEDTVLLFFGRLVAEKGLDMFEETVAILRQRGHNVRPLMVGEGPARARFEARLSDACFTGHLEGAALGRAVASADILVNPSVTEAFGNVNLEAMAAGLAIVSADAPSARALIEDGRNGILVPAKDASAYADAVSALIQDPVRRRALGAAALAASAAYEWDDVLKSVVETYRLAARERGTVAEQRQSE
jgi:glycosyltransferase involved in cell wall biosynthesis